MQEKKEAMDLLKKMFEREWKIHDTYERHAAYRSVLILGLCLGFLAGMCVGAVMGLMA